MIVWNTNILPIQIVEKARMPEWSKGLRSGRNVFALEGSSPSSCIFLFISNSSTKESIGQVDFSQLVLISGDILLFGILKSRLSLSRPFWPFTTVSGSDEWQVSRVYFGVETGCFLLRIVVSTFMKGMKRDILRNKIFPSKLWILSWNN